MKRNALALSAILVLLLALTSTLNSFVFADCFSSPSGLLHWYRGESNGLDSVGTNHAVLESGATAGVAAKVGNGFLFNGDALGGGANLGNVPDLDFAPGSSFSIEAWFNSFGQSDGGNDSQAIVLLNNACGNTVQSLSLANAAPYGAVSFIVRDATGQTGIVTSSPVSSNAFHHVVGVRQVSGGSNTVTLYIDGALVGSQVDLASGVLANNANDLIGRRNICGTQNTFFGLIDEVSIYSRALTANEGL